MKRSVSFTSPPPKKRSLVVPEPADPLNEEIEVEDAQSREGPQDVYVDPEPNIEYELVESDLDSGDIDSLNEKLAVISKEISRIKDTKVRGVYSSLNKVWTSLGALKNDIKNLKSNEYKIDKAFGQSNRLYAWMCHATRLQPSLALPEMKYRPGGEYKP